MLDSLIGLWDATIIVCPRRSDDRPREGLERVAPVVAVSLALSYIGALVACGIDDAQVPRDHSLVRAEIIDCGHAAQPVVATWVAGEGWEGALPEAGIGEDHRLSLGVRMHAADDSQLIERDGEFTARYEIADGADDTVLDMDRFELYRGDHVHMYGAAEGTTQIEFLLWHGDHVDGTTDPIDLTVSGDADVYREGRAARTRATSSSMSNGLRSVAASAPPAS